MEACLQLQQLFSSRENQLTSRINQQNEKYTSNYPSDIVFIPEDESQRETLQEISASPASQEPRRSTRAQLPVRYGTVYTFDVTILDAQSPPHYKQTTFIHCK